MLDRIVDGEQHRDPLIAAALGLSERTSRSAITLKTAPTAQNFAVRRPAVAGPIRAAGGAVRGRTTRGSVHDHQLCPPAHSRAQTPATPVAPTTSAARALDAAHGNGAIHTIQNRGGATSGRYKLALACAHYLNNAPKADRLVRHFLEGGYHAQDSYHRQHRRHHGSRYRLDHARREHHFAGKGHGIHAFTKCHADDAKCQRPSGRKLRRVCMHFLAGHSRSGPRMRLGKQRRVLCR
jgi:hypothetical protein